MVQFARTNEGRFKIKVHLLQERYKAALTEKPVCSSMFECLFVFLKKGIFCILQLV